MRRSIANVLFSLLPVLVCALSPLPVRAAPESNLVVNGSFENPPNIETSQIFTNNAPFPGWTVSWGSVEILGPAWQAVDGIQSLDLNGASYIGWIYQDVATVPGQNYLIRFAYASNPDCGEQDKSLHFSWGARELNPLRIPTTDRTRSEMNWKYHEVIAAASSGSTRLLFRSGTPSACGPAIDDVSVTAIDKPAMVSLMPGQISTPEGEPGLFEIRRYGRINQPLTVELSVAGTATRGDDYHILPGPMENALVNGTAVTIPARAYSALFAVLPIDDEKVEPRETVVITLVSNAAYTLNTATAATVTIQDKEHVVTIVASEPNAAEADRKSGVFKLSTTSVVRDHLRIYYTVSGSAKMGSDHSKSWELQQSMTSISIGRSSTEVTVDPLDDALVEGPETVVITLLTNSGYTLGQARSAAVTIVDNDLQPPPILPTVTVTANESSVWEDHGTRTFTITRSGDTTTDLGVQLTWGGTALRYPETEPIEAADYLQFDHFVVIPSGFSSTEIWAQTLDDVWNEGPESIVLSVSPDVAYVVGSQGSATMTIQDNDLLSTVSVAVADVSASENGRDPGSFTIRRSAGDLSIPLTVYFTLEGTAANGSDYFGWTGTGPPISPGAPGRSLHTWVTIPAGQTSANVTVTPNDDAEIETGETVVLTLDENDSYTIGPPGEGSGTITFADNDEPFPAPWRSRDIGQVGAAGSTSYADGSFSVTGSGADIGGAGDEFHYAYRTWTGDVAFVARVGDLLDAHAFAKAGVMFRATLDAASPNAFMLFRAGERTAFQSRASAGQDTWADGSWVTAPYWLKLVRRGNTFLGYESPNKVTWTLVGSTEINMPETFLVGLALTSHEDGALCTTAFEHVDVYAPGPVAPSDLKARPMRGGINLSWTDNSSNEQGFRIERSYDGFNFELLAMVEANVSSYIDRTAASLTTVYYRVQGTPPNPNSEYSGVATATPGAEGPLPSPWQSADIGRVGLTGSSGRYQGMFRVSGSGIEDFFGGYHYVYQPWSGDGEITARHSDIAVGPGPYHGRARSGVLFRESLAPGSPHVFLFVSPEHGCGFQTRTRTGQSLEGYQQGPYSWLRLARRSNYFSAYVSSDGTNWTYLSTSSLPVNDPIMVGLAVTSHSDSYLHSSVFGNVEVGHPHMAIHRFIRHDDGDMTLWIEGERGRTNAIETSTNLVHWTLLPNSVSTNALRAFTDTNAMNYPVRFYRLVRGE